MQALSLDQLVGQILGNYRIERFLASGRLNAVYLGRHLALQRLDAVTVYLVPAHFSSEARARFLARFHKEATAITQLEHSHILPIYEYGEYLGIPYLVTPYVTQGSLADLLKRYGRYDHSAIVPILEQLASGVAYAHSRGHIHGTLRPSNVVVRDQELLQVAGFGLMHMLQLGGIEKSELPYAHLLTVGQTFLASPEYIAPEVVRGQAIDRRSDIYTLGCMLFELLCGQPPFSGSDPLEIAQQHVTQEPPSLRILFPGVPIALVSVVNQALARDPARRFQYVEELKDAFIQASRGASSGSRQKGLPSEEKQSWSARVQTSGRLQSISPQGSKLSDSGKWQLLPPIVTGKLPALPQTLTPGEAVASNQHLHESQIAAVTLPPIVSAQPNAAGSPIPAPEVNNPYPASVLPSYLLDTEGDVRMGLPPLSPTAREAQEASPSPASNSLPGVYTDTEKLAESYAWWSQHGTAEVEKPLPATREGKPPFYVREEQEPNAQTVQIPPTREPLVVPVSDNWTSPGTFGSSTRKSSKNNKRSRRSVVALLAVGGVAAAGAAVVLNLDRVEALMGSLHQSATAYINTQLHNTPSQPAPNTQTHKTPPQPTPSPNTQNKKGTVIGNTQQKANSSVDFTNPATSTPGILVRLIDSTFAAYDKACTHASVLVYYDPATKLLVCPAHGAIFDPAKGGAVVHGPAQLPLPTIGIQVQADGTVTTV